MLPLYAIFLLLFLGILLVVFIILYLYANVYLIPPSGCNAGKGPFSVQPATTSAVINQCGTDKKQPRTFTGITSLNSAVNLCNQNSGVCSAFAYTPNINSVSFVQFAGTTTVSSSTDLYTRTGGITTV